ncbi:YbaK/EbsC family protein [Candidatus Bathyarchaeota archaeon]|nr:YbaK/EbsC family protein [Candidatus Bathyarchaeota archaeon]
MDSDAHKYSDSLEKFLVSNNIWHRFIEFDNPVKTVKQAARKVDAERIVKSIVLVDSNNQPLVAILRANDRISYKKLKTLLKVNDVRLGNEKEVLEYSGYPVGGVPPFNQIKRSYLDDRVTRITNVIAGGGDVNKLVELHSKDICDILKPVITDLIG